jgi:hypothetical protein
MKRQIRNYSPQDATRGKALVSEIGPNAETRGNTHTVIDQLVEHGAEPLRPRFGLLQSRVYNERNANKSRREDTFVDVYDLQELATTEAKGLEELGADDVTTTTSLVDATTTTPTHDFLRISDKIVQTDRNHADREIRTVESWNPRVDRIVNSPEGGGNDLFIRRQVVRHDDPIPTGSNIEAFKREQIGQDKYLDTYTYADGGHGTLTTEDNFGVESCKTVTETRKVPLDFELPAKSIDTVAESLQQIDGHKKIYTKTILPNGWPQLVSYEEEPVTGKRVEVTRTIHGTEPTVAVNGAARRVVSVRHTGCDRWTKVIREIDPSILTETFYEYHSVEYDFPSYLDPDTPFVIHSLGGGKELINAVKSSPHRFKIPCRFEITYHTSAPTAAEVFQFKPVTIEVDIPGRSIRERVITDALTITTDVFNEAYINVVTGNPPPAYAITEVTFNFPASYPTATNYIKLMRGEPFTDNDPPHEALILEDSSRWKYNLWRRVRVYMKFPDLTQALDDSLIY